VLFFYPTALLKLLQQAAPRKCSGNCNAWECTGIVYSSNFESESKIHSNPNAGQYWNV